MFSYNWSESNKTLTLKYTSDPSAPQRLNVNVKVIGSVDTYFDLQMDVQNAWDDTLEYVIFPSDLVFDEAKIEEALLPLLPGVLLEASFFLTPPDF